MTTVSALPRIKPRQRLTTL